MELKNYYAQDSQGNVQPGATCHLYESGTETYATGLKTANDAVLSNPFSSDGFGLIQFKAPNGLYDLRIVSGARDYRVKVQCLDVLETVALVEESAESASQSETSALNARDSSEAHAINSLSYLTQTQAASLAAQSAAQDAAADVKSELAAPIGSELIGFKSNLSNSSETTLSIWANRFLPTLEDFGGKGDYTTDNLAALTKLLASGAKGMRLNQGVYRVSDSVTFPTGFAITGVGAPTLGFGTVDDKQWLRPGYKHRIPGSSLIFSGASTKTYPAPQRVGEFSQMRPCVRLSQGGTGSVGTKWSGFAIIQDMDCFDASGVATKPGFENTSDYDTGLLLDDVARTDCNDVVVFGYFSKAGVVISSVLGNDDPDYNTFTGGSLMGKHGLAELGSNNGPASHGLSGTRLIGVGLYTLDHHSRASLTQPELISYYSTANTWSCWFIDGDVDASSAEINGHYAYGVEMRTRANHALRLGYASNVEFYGGICEQAPYGITNSDVPTFVGSANVKRGVAFYGLRNNYMSNIFNDTFVGLIPVPVYVSGDPLNGRIGVFGKDPAGGYSGSILGSDGNIGDASVQLTKDANNGSSGWRISMDVSSSNTLNTSYDGINVYSMTTSGIRVPTAGERRIIMEVGPALTIASGAITITRSMHAISPETGNTGTLNTINGGVAGQIITLRPVSSSHVITLERTGGNIRLDGSTNKTLNGSLSSIRLYYNGSLWVQDGSVMTSG